MNVLIGKVIGVTKTTKRFSLFVHLQSRIGYVQEAENRNEVSVNCHTLF